MFSFDQMGVDRVETRWEAFARLEVQYLAEEGQKVERIRSISLTSVTAEPKVFQHREEVPEALVGFETHLDRLLAAIKREPSNRLDPITIWRCGPEWVVLDGHFRLEAYRRYALEKGIDLKAFRVPCRVFIGSILEARDQSVMLNKKVSEPLTATERSNAAWQRVCLSWGGDGWNTSRAQMEALGLVSSNTIARMRRTLRELLEANGRTLEEAHELTWLGAMKELEEPKALDEDWRYDDEVRAREVQALADRFRKTFGSFPREAPLLFLEAMEVFSEQMVAAWRDELREDVEDF